MGKVNIKSGFISLINLNLLYQVNFKQVPETYVDILLTLLPEEASLTDNFESLKSATCNEDALTSFKLICEKLQLDLNGLRIGNFDLLLRLGCVRNSRSKKTKGKHPFSRAYGSRRNDFISD